MNPASNFKGHVGRECGEHRTVGAHRAWCHDCTEWCYPEIPCRGCRIPQLEAALNEANKLLEQTIEVLEGLAGMAEGLSFAHWWSGNGQPLLDNLKALKKEGTE
jgi:hypothetical protein